MRFENLTRLTVSLSFAGLMWAQPLPALAQQSLSNQDPGSEDVARGAFLTGRKKTPATDSNKTPPPNEVTPKQGKANSPRTRPPVGNRSSRRTGTQQPKVASPIVADPVPSVATDPIRIGAGFTLYQRNSQGEAIRVSPSKVFHKDDSVRFVIEPNIDGYLYIFYAEDDGEPQMIFPDHRLHQGDNKITAHVPYEVPSRYVKHSWFVFDEIPATENLLIVVTRSLLPDVPVGNDLVKFCQPIGEECTWKPVKSKYDVLLAQAGEPKIQSTNKTLGEIQTDAENQAIARGIKLKAGEPEPTLVHMNVSAAQNILVIRTQLIHR